MATANRRVGQAAWRIDGALVLRPVGWRYARCTEAAWINSVPAIVFLKGIHCNRHRDGRWEMEFEVVGAIRAVETFAVGNAIRELRRLQRIYGKGRWRKRKGVATVRFPMAPNARLKSIGLRLPVSGASNSKSNTFWMNNHAEAS